MSQDLDTGSWHRNNGFVFPSVGCMASGGGAGAGEALLSPRARPCHWEPEPGKATVWVMRGSTEGQAPSLAVSEPGKAGVWVMRGSVASWLKRS